MEVQGRPPFAQGRLTGVVAAAWARRWAALALATVLMVATVVVDAQPVRSPWWTYADADASYTAGALNLLNGERVRYVDHPGIPLTELTAVAFAFDALAHEGSLSAQARDRYVDARLLDLDSTRGIFRGIAIAWYLAGAALSFSLLSRLFRHWTWGLAGGLLWLAAPGLTSMSIQLRPDVPLAVLALAFAYALARAVEDRDPVAYAASAVVAGFAVTMKVHALGLLVPLLAAAAWRAPEGGWRGVIGAVRSRPRLLAALIPLGAAAILLNWLRWPYTPTAAQLLALLAVAGVTGVAWAAGSLVARLRPLALVAPAVAAGLLVPVAIDVPDGLQALVIIGKTIAGQEVQAGVDPFSTRLSQFPSIVGPPVVLVFALAAVAAVIGLVRRDPTPVVWAIGGAAMILLAFARPPAVHYFVPAFVLAFAGLLWLLSRGRPSAPILVWPVVLLLASPAIRDREAPAADAERFAAVVRPTKAVVDARLRDGEVAIVPINWPFADARYFELAQRFVDDPPPYPFRYLAASAAAREFATVHGWRPRYFISPDARAVNGTEIVDVGSFGRYSARRLTGTDLGLELLARVKP